MNSSPRCAVNTFPYNGTITGMWYCYACTQYHANGTTCPTIAPQPSNQLWNIYATTPYTDIRPNQIVVEVDPANGATKIMVKSPDGVILNTIVLDPEQAKALKFQL